MTITPSPCLSPGIAHPAQTGCASGVTGILLTLTTSELENGFVLKQGLTYLERW
jgi:hypothetical protein